MRRWGQRFLWVLGYAVVAAASLWVRAAIPIQVVGSGADDYLFVRLAGFLKAGQWLGPYDHYTLVKGIAYPAFIAAASAAGVPLKIAEHVVYLAAAAIACLVVHRFTRSRWLAFLLFAALAFNPVVWAEEYARVLRDGLYMSLTLALVALAAAAFFPREDARAGTAVRIALMASVGLVAGIYWITREEGIWLAPAALVLVGAALVREWRRTEGARRAVRAALRVALRAAPAVLVFAAVVGGVAFKNWKHYGVFELTEFKSGAFRAAYGALLRIRHDQWRHHIEFPTDARERAYAVSPLARELRVVLDGPQLGMWRGFGCRTGPCDEIRSGFFIWAMRDAAALNGHHASAREAAAFYRRLALEINAACDAGQIPCLPPRATLAPPFRWQYVSETIAAVPAIGQWLLASGAGRVVSRPRPGAPTAGLEGYVRMVGPVATDERANQAAQMRFARGLADVVVAVMPTATLIATLGLLLAPLFAHVRRRLASLLILLLACGAAIVSRVVLMAYLDVTSLDNAADYVTAASALLVVFVVCGLYVAYLVAREAMRRARASRRLAGEGSGSGAGGAAALTPPRS